MTQNLQGSSPFFEIDQPELYGDLMLYSAPQILAFLRSIQQQQLNVAVYVDECSPFFVSPILDIDAERGLFFLDTPRDPGVRQALSKPHRFTLVALLDKVKIQIRFTEIRATTLQQRSALAIPIPKSLLRLQRREFYRLETPLSEKLQCKLAVKRADGSLLAKTLPILDLSGGGLGLMESQDKAETFLPSQIYSECRIEIPGEGFLSANLCIRSKHTVELRGGRSYVRVGCEFMNLHAARLAQIERYITRVERERKARMQSS